MTLSSPWIADHTCANNGCPGRLPSPSALLSGAGSICSPGAGVGTAASGVGVGVGDGTAVGVAVDGCWDVPTESAWAVGGAKSDAGAVACGVGDGTVRASRTTPSSSLGGADEDGGGAAGPGGADAATGALVAVAVGA